MLRIIGITGGICCGKSTATAYLADTFSVLVVDADKLGHEAYLSGTPCFQAMVDTFGPQVIGSDGEIDRRVLGPIVFSDPAEMEKLQQIVWPVIAHLITGRITQAETDGLDTIVFEAAVLIEAGWNALMNEVWVLWCDPDVAKERLVHRNSWTEEKAEQVIATQISNAERLRLADVEIDSNGTRDEVAAQLHAAFTRS